MIAAYEGVDVDVWNADDTDNVAFEDGLLVNGWVVGGRLINGVVFARRGYETPRELSPNSQSANESDEGATIYRRDDESDVSNQEGDEDLGADAVRYDRIMLTECRATSDNFYFPCSVRRYDAVNVRGNKGDGPVVERGMRRRDGCIQMFGVHVGNDGRRPNIFFRRSSSNLILPAIDTSRFHVLVLIDPNVSREP